jgi:uncharacterized protein YggE
MKRTALLTLLVASPLLAQSPLVSPSSRTVNVTGEAVEYVTPDEAVIRVGVETFAADLAASTSANDQRGGQLVQALRGAGVEEKDIQADHADLEIVYQRDGIAQGVAGYRMRRAYSITLRDVKKLDSLVRLALRSGANHLDGYELRTSQLRKYRDEVRKRAITAAREKAEALAGELGCRIGDPVSINEGFYGWFGNRGGWNSGMNAMSQNAGFAAGVSGGSEPEATPIGQIGVRAQISVVFDLIPRPR